MNETNITGDTPYRSLRYQIISRGALRSLLVAVALCAASYYHVVSILEQDLKLQLSNYIAERGIRDSFEFIQAERHHGAFEKKFIEQMQQVPVEQGAALFDDYFEQWADGTYRTKKAWYEGHIYKDSLLHSEFTGFVGKDVQLDPAMRQRIAIVAALLDWYGTAWTATGQYVNYFVTGPDNFLVGEFIGFPYLHEVPADIYFPDEIFSSPANAVNNPSRKTVWTRFYFDETAKVWLVSSLRPIYFQDKHVATAGQDILLDDFMQRVIADKFANTDNIAFDAEGRLIAHESWHAQLRDADSVQFISQEGNAFQRVYEATIKETAKSGVVEIDDAYLAYTRISGPEWLLVNIYPKSLLQKHGGEAALVILGIAMLGLLAEFVVLWTLINNYVLVPLNGMLLRVRRFGKKDQEIENDSLGALGCREFEELSQSFGNMAKRLDQSLEKQREINRNLDQLVAARTEELERANAKLESLAITDDLTNLFNRRHFKACLESELARAQRLEHSEVWLSLTILDIDYFKRVNDAFGHQAGDSVIKAVADCLRRQHQRANEKCFRIGGEEFAVLSVADIYNESSVRQSTRLLLEAIRSLEVMAEDECLTGKITVSIGVVFARVSQMTTMESMFHDADESLYRAKNSGRNQGCIVVKPEVGKDSASELIVR